MVIGGYDPRLTKPGAQMAFTPLTKGSGWFTVKVKVYSSIRNEYAIVARQRQVVRLFLRSGFMMGTAHMSDSRDKNAGMGGPLCERHVVARRDTACMQCASL